MTILWRTRFWWFVALPWVGLYYAAASFGVPRDAFHPGLLAWEPLPVWPWTSLFYFSEYPAVAAVPLLVTAPERCRQLMIHCWIAIAIAFLFYFTLPSIAPRPPVPQDAFLGPILAWERGNYPASVAFPSFHVIWAVLIAHAATGPKSPSWAHAAWWGWALAVSASCVTTGMHWLSDIAAGLVVSWIAIRYESIWTWLNRTLPNPAWILGFAGLSMLLRRMYALDAHWYSIVAIALGLPAVAALARFGLSKTKWT